ncbi:MAG: DUF3169 family protein [Clostridiales bacterium]|nr:DUF3169 family protein [Clostridiales bacterium]
MNNINNDEAKKLENKAENKHAFKRFIGVMIVGAIVGGIIGFLTQYLPSKFSLDLTDLLPQLMVKANPFILILIFVICGVLTLAHYNKAKSMYKQWDGEDEYYMNDLEMHISKTMLILTIGSIAGLFGLGIQVYAISGGIHHDESVSQVISGTVILFLYVALCLFFVFCQKKAVDLLKIINPEKKGSIYDKKFSEKWIEHCDEAERMNIYKSAYAAYKFMNVFLVVLWAVTAFAVLMYGIGLLAMTLVSVSWLAMNLVYCLKSMKMEKIKKD